MRLILAFLLVASAAPAVAENWQLVAKHGNMSLEIDRDHLRGIEHTSFFTVRVKYPANSVRDWKGDTLVAAGTVGCGGSGPPLFFQDFKYFRNGRLVGTDHPAPFATSPLEPAETLKPALLRVVCAK